jgi:hypothetical protein
MFPNSKYIALFALALFLLSLRTSAQETARRLILKDGSYQLVTKYEIKGERVRYYSTEREDWEELPNALVDWPATAKYEKDRAANASAPEAIELDRELAHEEELAEAKLPEVAPHLRLPESQGVFLFDAYQGEPEINELQQSAGDMNRNTKGNILRGAVNPIASMKQTIELDGAHAKIQAHVQVPSIYINVDSPDQQGGAQQNSDARTQNTQQPQQPEQAIVPFERFRIIRSEIKGDKRIVGDVKRQITGKITQEQKFVKTTITRVAGGWLKLTPVEPLAPGEYALVEMMGKEGMNLDVWDFGINPKAPANANPWKPEKKTPPAPKASNP